MTDRGYVGTDFELVDLIDAQTLQETRSVLEDLLTTQALAGRAGRRIAERSRFRGRTVDTEVRAYIDQILNETDMRLGVCDWVTASIARKAPLAKATATAPIRRCGPRVRA